MLELKEYVAVQDFTMSLDNGKTPIYVKRGENLGFDGLNVSFRNEQGTARPLAKVIGEWIVAVSEKAQVAVKTAPKTLARTSRNATGDRIVEHSDYPSDPVVGVRNQPNDSIDNLLKGYDKMPETKLVNGRREVTGDLEDIKKEVTIIHEEDSVVKKVTAVNGAPVTNKSGVEMGADTSKRGVVLSQEGQVAKETNYSGKVAATGESKKLVIDYEASGTEVRKVSQGSANVTKPTTTGVEVVANEVDMGETSYPANQTTEVGSSTQVQTVQRKVAKRAPAKKGKSVAKKGAAKRAPVAKAPVRVSTAPTVAKGVVVDSGGQEAVVISKVTRDKASSVLVEDGITSRVMVGASGDMDVGEVTFSSNNDFEEPTATFSAGEDTVADILGGDAVIVESDDIDLNDLLSE